MQGTDESFLEELARTARERVASGYYRLDGRPRAERLSLARALGAKDRIPIISEVKFRSPSQGWLGGKGDATQVASTYERAGASGISVLTEPEHFDGRLEYLPMVKDAVRIPVMMKDIVVDEAQVEAGYRGGADVVLLVAGIFEKGDLERMIASVHSKAMEAVVEVHGDDELALAASSEADVIGINNRDLRTLEVSTEVSRRLLSKGPFGKPVVCESGISTREEIDSLRKLGADGFLIGSALMRSEDPQSLLRKLSSL